GSQDHPADGQGHHHRQREEDLAAALRLRGGEDAGHRRRGERHHRRERCLRLSGCPDRQAGRCRDAGPLQSRAREGDRAAGSGHRDRRTRPGARKTLMPVEVILPKVDMDMATGQISRWFVAEGTTVKQGDLLFEIETDKRAMEIYSPASGTFRDIVGKEGVDIPVGSPVAWIYAEGEAVQNMALTSPSEGGGRAEGAGGDDTPSTPTAKPET